MSATSNRLLFYLAISAASVLVLSGCATAKKSAESAPAAAGAATSETATVASNQFLKGLEVAERPELEPEWGPYVKDHFPSWRKHYWVDRGQWGNRGYIVGQPPTVQQPTVEEQPSPLAMPPVIVPSEAPNVETPAKPTTYTVKKGDCLWRIAGRVYHNPFKWGRIYRANKDKIKNPNRIYPKQVLTIPWD
jgi:nucleoid-associated protein YgaU